MLAIIAGAGFLALLMVGVTGCSSSTTPPSDTSKMFTSTVSNAHTHTVTIEKTSVQTPPAGGISETTSSTSGHTHSFDLTQAQLTTINGGTPVTQTSGSSAVGGVHTHDFTISKWF
jgi:hypothetical protein